MGLPSFKSFFKLDSDTDPFYIIPVVWMEEELLEDEVQDEELFFININLCRRGDELSHGKVMLSGNVEGGNRPC